MFVETPIHEMDEEQLTEALENVKRLIEDFGDVYEGDQYYQEALMRRDAILERMAEIS